MPPPEHPFPLQHACQHQRAPGDGAPADAGGGAQHERGGCVRGGPGSRPGRPPWGRREEPTGHAGGGLARGFAPGYGCPGWRQPWRCEAQRGGEGGGLQRQHYAPSGQGSECAAGCQGLAGRGLMFSCLSIAFVCPVSSNQHLNRQPLAGRTPQDWAEFGEFAAEVVAAVDSGAMTADEAENRLQPAVMYQARPRCIASHCIPAICCGNFKARAKLRPSRRRWPQEGWCAVPCCLSERRLGKLCRHGSAHSIEC